MKPVLLSIVIPSYNGAERIINLLKILEEIVPESVKSELEVVISDNQSDPKIQLSEEIGLGNRLKIVSPSMHLLTAEENLLFALQHSSGSYCWILGDDDVPIKNGFQMLLELVQTSEFELMIFNSLAFDINSNSWDIHRLDLDRMINTMPFVDFVKRAGFWSITAGFSTLAFKRTAFDLSFMQNLHIDGLKIYSHVTTLLKSFHDKSFAAIALPLVKYSSNSFDDEPAAAILKDPHWIRYAQNQNEPYRSPWTLSFIRQIKVLEDEKVFSMADLFDVLDQGHLGQRFFLFDFVLAFVVDQVLFQIRDDSLKPFTREELSYVLQELSGKNAEIDRLIGRIKLSFDSADQQIELGVIAGNLTSTEGQIKRRLVLKLSGGSIYRIPFGYFWTPMKPDINTDFKSLTSPKNGLYSTNLIDLEEKISMFIVENPLYAAFDISKSLNIQGLNSQVSKSDKIAMLIPRFIRRKFTTWHAI
jgi:glycosyltransferase involved in cell wall biosynthesis